MEAWFFSLILVFGFMILVLAVKIYFLRRAAREISEAFKDRLTTDTNTLIDISSRDFYMRKLAAEINVQLRLLRSERHRYQQGDLELKEAVTNISHDLRTPLTAIKGYLDLLEREEKSAAAARYLAQIENRTEALKNLTEELFRYSVVASQKELVFARVDMVRALEESLLSFYALMQEKGITPQLCLPEEAVWRKLDAGALNRIFSNIISNALKYSDGDFSVILEETGRITFSNTANSLDAVAVGRLFDRFYTVETSHNATGLGLSIARLLTERMGGSILAEYQTPKLKMVLQFPGNDENN